MKCTNSVMVKMRGRNVVYKVYYYNNNLTNCQSVTFTSIDRAMMFIKSISAENSVPMVYLETFVTDGKHVYKLKS